MSITVKYVHLSLKRVLSTTYITFILVNYIALAGVRRHLTKYIVFHRNLIYYRHYYLIFDLII